MLGIMALLKLYSGGLLFALYSLVTVNHANQDFIVNPMNITTYIGANAKFQCYHPNTTYISWYINGIVLLERERQEHNESCSHGTLFTEDQDASVHILIVNESPLECNGIQVQCRAISLDIGNMTVTEIGRSGIAILILEELHLKTLRLSGRNGSMLIMWELPIYLMDQNIIYELNIFPLKDTTGIMPQCIPINGYNASMYTFNTTYPSACDILTITIIPSINEYSGQKISKNGSLYQELSKNTNYSIIIAGVTFNWIDMELIYEIMLLSNQISVCFLSINATNLLTNQTIKLKKKLDTQLTTMLTFRVNDTELPFDEDYIATVEFENPQNSNRINKSIDLSTQAIQNAVFYENSSHLLLSFVHNTSYRGALVVIGNMQSRLYDYMAVTKEGDVMEYNISEYNLSCRFNCTLLVYTIKGDGLPKLNTSLRPIMNSRKHLELHPGLHFEESSSASPDMNNQNSINKITAEVEVSRHSIIFKCSVDDTDGNSEIEGCITIVHSDVDSSTLIINNVTKNSNFELFLNETLFEGDQHLYAIFPWKKRSGLLRSEVVAKGIATLQNVEPQNIPPGAIAGIVIGTVTVTVSAALIIISIIVIIKKSSIFPSLQCKKHHSDKNK